MTRALVLCVFLTSPAFGLDEGYRLLGFSKDWRHVAMESWGTYEGTGNRHEEVVVVDLASGGVVAERRADLGRYAIDAAVRGEEVPVARASDESLAPVPFRWKEAEYELSLAATPAVSDPCRPLKLGTREYSAEQLAVTLRRKAPAGTSSAAVPPPHRLRCARSYRLAGLHAAGPRFVAVVSYAPLAKVTGNRFYLPLSLTPPR